MSTPPGQRAKPGDRVRDVVTAQAWNSLIDLRDQFARSQQGANIGASPLVSRDCLVEVRNDTGADLTRYACIGLDGVTVEPSENVDEFTERHVLLAEIYDGVDATKFAVVQEDIPDGEIGRAVVCGVTIAQINVGSTLHKFAKPVADDTVMVTADSGYAKLLHVEEIGDDKLGLIVIGGGLVETNNTTGGHDGTSWLGCDITDCLPESSAFMVEKTCGGCSKLPLAYELVTGAGTVDNDCSIFGYDQRPGVGLIQPHYTNWILTAVDIEDPENCTYESPEIECDAQLDGRCGYATWVWSTGFREVDCSVTWTATENTCPGCQHEWLWTGGPNWVYQGQIGDCAGGVQSPSQPPAWTSGPTTVYTPCTSSTQPYVWECSNDFRQPECDDCDAQGGCDGGASTAMPTTPPASLSDTVTRTCTISVPDEDATGWELTVECNCGTTDPPPVDGTVDGQTYSMRCVQEEGYENPAKYKWRLIVDGCDTTLQLLSIAPSGSTSVVWTYEPVAPRCWCCNCTNTMVSRSCGPYPRGFYAPGVICLKPATVSGCPAATLFDDGAEVEIDIPCIDNGAGNGMIFGLSGPVPYIDEYLGPYRYWPGETALTQNLFGGGVPNCNVTCSSDDVCEFHSPVSVVDIDGVDHWIAVSMCFGFVEGVFVISVWVNIAAVAGSLCGSSKVGYVASGLDPTNSEFVLTLSEDVYPYPPCGTDYTGWPETITVTKY
jgi:hypothetical protein